LHSDALTLTKQELINTKKEEVKLNKYNILEEIKDDELSKKVRYFLLMLDLFTIILCL